MSATCRKTPCPACPYRRDVPSGVWAPEEYDKLRRYDAPTGDQPAKAFMCHATPERLCHGWAVVHSQRGHAFDLLALRLMFLHDAEVPEVGAVPLFSSGSEAADHGQREVRSPSPAAEEAMARLRRYPRLADQAAREARRDQPAAPLYGHFSPDGGCPDDPRRAAPYAPAPVAPESRAATGAARDQRFEEEGAA